MRTLPNLPPLTLSNAGFRAELQPQRTPLAARLYWTAWALSWLGALLALLLGFTGHLNAQHLPAVGNVAALNIATLYRIVVA